ncbi:hypothetical protein TNCV_1244271 [Trichonephila clavipes]|nr:hypothetical protein TNCV_1244271 [Trichonephila clavipes]
MCYRIKCILRFCSIKIEREGSCFPGDRFVARNLFRVSSVPLGIPPIALVLLYIAKSGNGIWNLSPDAGWDLKMWEIVSPYDPDQDNGTKSLNYCIVIVPRLVSTISN